MANGPFLASPVPSGCGKGVSDLPRLRAAHTAKATPPSASTAPIAVSASRAPAGQAGGRTPVAMIAAIRANWVTTQPEPRPAGAGSAGGSGELDEDRIAEAHAVHLVDQRVRRGLVDRERHQGLLPVTCPRDGHVRDVGAVLTEQRPDLADHAGDVVVTEEDHVGCELDVDPEAVRARE